MGERVELKVALKDRRVDWVVQESCYNCVGLRGDGYIWMRADLAVKVFSESSDSFIQRLNVCIVVEFVYVGYSCTSPDLACVGQYWLEVLQVNLPFAIVGKWPLENYGLSFTNINFYPPFGQPDLEFFEIFLKIDSYYVGATGLKDDCGVVCEEADMDCWCGGEVMREDIVQKRR
ncbi:hypothetical protein TNCV_2871551 [Trichonephila clavipes]|nr:hypothetical protein TNCV_2871551 [Trichonephila clavipes]